MFKHAEEDFDKDPQNGHKLYNALLHFYHLKLGGLNPKKQGTTGKTERTESFFKKYSYLESVRKL